MKFHAKRYGRNTKYLAAMLKVCLFLVIVAGGWLHLRFSAEAWAQNTPKKNNHLRKVTIIDLNQKTKQEATLPKCPANVLEEDLGLSGIWEGWIQTDKGTSHLYFKCEHRPSNNSIAFDSSGDLPKSTLLGEEMFAFHNYTRIAKVRYRGDQITWGTAYGGGSVKLTVVDWNTLKGTYSYNPGAYWLHYDKKKVKKGMRAYPATFRRVIPEIYSVTMIDKMFFKDWSQQDPPIVNAARWFKIKKSRLGDLREACGPVLVLKGNHFPLLMDYPYSVKLTDPKLGVLGGSVSRGRKQMSFRLSIQKGVKPGPKDIVIMGRRFPNAFVVINQPEPDCQLLKKQLLKIEDRLTGLKYASHTAWKIIRELHRLRKQWLPIARLTPNPDKALDALQIKYESILASQPQLKDMSNLDVVLFHIKQYQHVRDNADTTMKFHLQTLSDNVNDLAEKLDQPLPPLDSEDSGKIMSRLYEVAIPLGLTVLPYDAEMFPPVPASVGKIDTVENLRKYKLPPVTARKKTEYFNSLTQRMKLKGIDALPFVQKEDAITFLADPPPVIRQEITQEYVDFVSIMLSNKKSEIARKYKKKLRQLQNQIGNYEAVQPGLFQVIQDVYDTDDVYQQRQARIASYYLMLMTAIVEHDRLMRYERLRTTFHRQADSRHVQAARRLIALVDRHQDRLTQYRDHLDEAIRINEENHARLYDAYIHCLSRRDEAVTELRAEMKRIHHLFAIKYDQIKTHLQDDNASFDQWWDQVEGGFIDVQMRAYDYSGLILKVMELGGQSDQTYLVEMVKGVDTFDLLWSTVGLLKALGKGGLWVGKKIFSGKGKIASAIKRQAQKILGHIDDLAKALGKNAEKAARSAARPTEEYLQQAAKVFGSGANAEKKASKLYHHLSEGMKLSPDQIKKVMAAATDPKTRKEVLGHLRDSLIDAQKLHGDFAIKSVGTGSKVDDYLRTGKNLPDAKDWNFHKNDYDVSVYVPPETVNHVIDKMKRKELDRYLKQLGYKAGTDIHQMPNADAVKQWIAEKRIIQSIEGGFKARNKNIGIEAYDNMYFSGSPTRATRQDHVAQLIDILPKDAGYGKFARRKIDDLIRQGKADQILKNLPDSISQAKRHAIENLVHKAADADSAAAFYRGKVPAWRSVKVYGDDAFLTPGGKKLVELMQESAGTPFTKIGKGKLSKIAADDLSTSVHKYLHSDFHITPADGADMLTEMKTFFHSNHKKTVDKVAKYYVRAAMGKMASDPTIAKQIQKQFLSSAYRGLNPEERIVAMAKHFSKQGKVFNAGEIKRLEQALALKYPKKYPKLSQAAKAMDQKLLRRDLTRDLKEWYQDGMKKYEKYATGHLSPAQRSLHEASRNVTMSRLDKDTLLKQFDPGLGSDLPGSGFKRPSWEKRAALIADLQKNKAVHSATSRKIASTIKASQRVKENRFYQALKSLKGLVSGQTTPRQMARLLGKTVPSHWGKKELQKALSEAGYQKMAPQIIKAMNLENSQGRFAASGGSYPGIGADEAKNLRKAASVLAVPPDPTVSSVFMELLSNPRSDFQAEITQFEGDEGAIERGMGRLVWASYKYALNPFGFIARVIKSYIRYFFYIDFKKHDQLMFKLAGKMDGLISKLDMKSQSNALSRAIHFVPEEGGRYEIMLKWTIKEQEQFTDRIAQRIRQLKKKSATYVQKAQMEGLTKLLSQHRQFVEGTVYSQLVELNNLEIQPVIARSKNVEETAKWLKQAVKPMEILKRSMQKVNENINGHMKWKDYESIKASFGPGIFMPLSGVWGWAGLMQYQVQKRSDAEGVAIRVH